MAAGTRRAARDATRGSPPLIGLLLPGANGLLFIAEQTVPTGLASLIIASVPLIVVVLRIAGGDRPPALAIAGVVLGFVGIAVLFAPQAAPRGSGSRSRACRRSPGRSARTCRRAPAAARRIRRDDVRDARRRAHPAPDRAGPAADPGSFSGASLAAFAYLVVFGSLVGFTAYVWLLHHALGTASTYAYVNPVVAIALGVLFLDERLTWQILVGAAIVLASVAVVVRRESEAAVEPFAE